MEKYTGKAAYQGIAIGKIAEMVKSDGTVRREHIDDVDAELARLAAAKEQAIDELQALYDKALKDVGEAHAEIFQVHQMMLDDDDYNESIEEMIKEQKVNAEFAVATTGDNFAEMFASMDSPSRSSLWRTILLRRRRFSSTRPWFSRSSREQAPPTPIPQFWPAP